MVPPPRAPAPRLGPAAGPPEAGAPSVEAGEAEEGTLQAVALTLWPTRGWRTSEFGVRVDPVTAERAMHRGIDIATVPGAPVVAPSDGVVLFAGVDGAYGKVLVLDHGFGVRTRYGHLSEIEVRLGQPVKRGARIAMVGNTGRSTGPHLHYEVQVDGISSDPARFARE